MVFHVCSHGLFCSSKVRRTSLALKSLGLFLFRRYTFQKFYFSPFIYDSIFILALPSISAGNLTIKCQIKPHHQYNAKCH